ncbi:hypothetical protein [Aurantibacter sp.]
MNSVRVGAGEKRDEEILVDAGVPSAAKIGILFKNNKNVINNATSWYWL